MVLPVSLAVLAATALAATPSLTATFSGPSVHKRYSIQVTPQCTTSPCKHATTISVSVQSLHKNALCGTLDSYQIPGGPLKGGRFAESGEFIGPAKATFTLKASGHFSSATHVVGTVTGPKKCGGTDTFSLKSTG